MRKSILFTAFLFCVFTLHAQSADNNIAVGDVIVLGEPSGSSYSNIDFPQKNIIIKRGAIANFNALIGKQLLVKRIDTDKYGTTIATLQREDGLNFFRFFPKAEANLTKALASGELKTL